MTKLTISVQGSGGGIKTRLVNLELVAKELEVRPEYPLNFIAIELGTQVEYRKNDGICLINGKHELSAIEDKLFKFIDKYVLCPSIDCRLPEIIISIVNKEVRCKCKVCSKSFKLDNSHKIIKHIIKNPPEYEDKTAKSVGNKKEEVSKGPVLDKEVKQITRNLLSKSDEIIRSNKESNSIAQELMKMYGDIEADKKYYALIHSLYDCNIFKYFKTKSIILKQILANDNKQKEAVYHILIAIIDLTIQRYSKDYFDIITKHIPSILYVLYEEDIITEEFYSRFIKGKFKIKNIFFEKDNFLKFTSFAEEFTKWIEL